MRAFLLLGLVIVVVATDKCLWMSLDKDCNTRDRPFVNGDNGQDQCCAGDIVLPDATRGIAYKAHREGREWASFSFYAQPGCVNPVEQPITLNRGQRIRFNPPLVIDGQRFLCAWYDEPNHECANPTCRASTRVFKPDHLFRAYSDVLDYSTEPAVMQTCGSQEVCCGYIHGSCISCCNTHNHRKCYGSKCCATDQYGTTCGDMRGNCCVSFQPGTDKCCRSKGPNPVCCDYDEGRAQCCKTPDGMCCPIVNGKCQCPQKNNDHGDEL